MEDRITIVLEAKCAPGEATRKLAQLEGMLSLFIAEVGADVQIESRTDSFLTTSFPGQGFVTEGETLNEMLDRREAGIPQQELRVQARATIELGS